MIQNRKLFLANVALLPDKFEGSMPRADSRTEQLILKAKAGTPLTSAEERALHDANQFSDDIDPSFRNIYFVNCWRSGNDESEAMWQLYCPGGNGIAIQTTYKKLLSEMAGTGMYIGAVSYIDYDTERLPSADRLTAVMHKRRSFEHESEVRIVKIAVPPSGGPKVVPGIVEDFDLGCIEKIYVSPYAPNYFFTVFASLLEKLSPYLSDKLVPMRDPPRYV